MAARTKIYSVYVRKDVSSPLDTAVFVSSGFNIWAFIFFVGWSLFNRLWLLSVFLGIISGLLMLNDTTAFTLISFLFNVWFGFEANNLKAYYLEKKGYILIDVVAGIDTIAAEQRFYDRYLMNRQAKQSSFSTMKPAAS